MDDSGIDILPVTPESARKRKSNPAEWKRNKLKSARYSSVSLPEYPTCKHNTKAYQCRTLTMQDIGNFHKSFYSEKDKIKQDNFLLAYCNRKIPKRHRPSKSNRPPKTCTIKYFVRRANDGKKIPVCRNTFLNILLIKKHRVQRSFLDGGTMAKERRGGDRKSAKNILKRQSVMKFIEKFKGTEPHYCRSKTSRRLYLPSDLSIRLMWKMYLKDTPEELSVKQSFFRNIFNSNYNLGFGSPRVDVCSKCLELSEKIKIANGAEKVHLITIKRVHKLKAKAFYNFLKEEREDLLIMSFDCQKNMSLPKVPDQKAYFSRQWSFYNFTIVVGNSHTSLDEANVHIYYWNETERPKGSNEIASAVFHRLCNTNFENINTVRLVADGCGGQNKNSTLIGMLSKWFLTAPSNVKKIEVIFPIVGHSFIPPDRVFARIEKKIKKLEIVIEPDEYVHILKQHGSIWKLGTDFPVQDFKKATQEVLKPPGQWHFKFNPSKRFILTKTQKNNILIRGEEAYRSDLGSGKLVTKKGKLIRNLIPAVLRCGIAPNINKKRDVAALLTAHYGENWREIERLSFYAGIEASEETNHEEGMTCEPLEEVDDVV